MSFFPDLKFIHTFDSSWWNFQYAQACWGLVYFSWWVSVFCIWNKPKILDKVWIDMPSILNFSISNYHCCIWRLIRTHITDMESSKQEMKRIFWSLTFCWKNISTRLVSQTWKHYHHCKLENISSSALENIFYFFVLWTLMCKLDLWYKMVEVCTYIHITQWRVMYIIIWKI